MYLNLILQVNYVVEYFSNVNFHNFHNFHKYSYGLYMGPKDENIFIFAP